MLHIQRTSLVDGQRQCSSCKAWLPATLEYFYADSRNSKRLEPVCKACKNKQAKEVRQKKAAQHALETHPLPGYKRCNECGEIKLLDKNNFVPMDGNKDGFYGDCRECKNRRRVEKKHSDPGFIDSKKKGKRSASRGRGTAVFAVQRSEAAESVLF